MEGEGVVQVAIHSLSEDFSSVHLPPSCPGSPLSQFPQDA